MNRFVKKLTAAVLALVLALSVAACGVTPTQQAESVVKGMLDAFKAMDFETASKYLSTEDTFDSEEIGDFEMFLKMLEKLQYEIVGSEQVSGEQVRVTVKITAVDMQPVIGKFMAKALEYAFANAFADPAPTEEETNEAMLKILNDLLAAEDLAMTTSETVINVVKTEDGWKVQGDDTFADALFGGLGKALEQMENAFGE